MKKTKRILTVIAAIIGGAAVITVLLLATVAVYVYSNIDFSFDESLFDLAGKWSSTVFYSSNSDESESAEIDVGGSFRKIHCELNEMSDYLKRGIIAVEDRKFPTHNGVDIKRTAAAILNYIFKGEKRFGASTITQQVIKNISGDNEITVKRKFSEIVRALHIESEYTKNEILEVYLNIIPLGENMYGVASASRGYFNKSPKDLSIAEAATLIGITNAPTTYNPYINPQECLKKRNSVLAVMYSEGVITKDEFDAATKEALIISPREYVHEPDSWFVETVIEDVSRDLAEKYSISKSAARTKLLGGGYMVYTTEDHTVQAALEEYFENLDNFPPDVANGLEFAITVMKNNGDLAGIVGRVGEKKGNRLLNHALANHTPGSVIKPLCLYAPLLEENKINPATVFDDVPVDFYNTQDGYRPFPKNSPNVYSGLITVKDALRLSKNTVAVRLCKMRGLKAVFNTLKQDFDFDTLVDGEKGSDGHLITDMSLSPLALGQLSKGVSLLKLTTAYTVFPSGGTLNNYRSYTKVVDIDGKAELCCAKKEKKVFSRDTANLMNCLLGNVVKSGTASSITIKNTIDTAGKTGTSGGNKDKLFIGYTPYYTAGIWCGYDDGIKSIGSISPGHLEIWDNVMQIIHRDKSVDKRFSLDGLIWDSFCLDSGERIGENCLHDPRGDRLDGSYFKVSSRPIAECHRHVVVDYDVIGKGVATHRCPHEQLTRVSLVKVYERNFPIEIFVTDAEFVYRDVRGYDIIANNDMPFFAAALPDGVFVGKSKKHRQFNSACQSHAN